MVLWARRIFLFCGVLGPAVLKNAIDPLMYGHLCGNLWEYGLIAYRLRGGLLGASYWNVIA